MQVGGDKAGRGCHLGAPFPSGLPTCGAAIRDLILCLNLHRTQPLSTQPQPRPAPPSPAALMKAACADTATTISGSVIPRVAAM